MSSPDEQLDAVRNGAVFCDFSSRTQVEIRGNDRAKVLHGLCTNDIKRLQAGDGCEAFLTDVQGKTIAYVYVFCLEDSLVLETVEDTADHIIQSIDRYIIREDVELIDRTSDWGEVLLSGARSATLLSELIDFELPSGTLGTRQGRLGSIEIEARNVPFSAPQCYFLRCAAPDVAALGDALQSAGAIACNREVIEVGRVEMGTPLFGQDITDDNLPQEVNRDSQAISFSKGCYLGQETVARIDALGHVNRKLVGLAFAGEQVPPPGTFIERDGKRLATITSSCHSPRRGQPIALAYVKRGLEGRGTKFESSFGEASVITLPVA